MRFFLSRAENTTVLHKCLCVDLHNVPVKISGGCPSFITVKRCCIGTEAEVVEAVHLVLGISLKYYWCGDLQSPQST